MKITKKMRKKANGMNYVTAQNFKDGFSPPVYKNIAKPIEVARYVKIKNGTPYVNPDNF